MRSREQQIRKRSKLIRVFFNVCIFGLLALGILVVGVGFYVHLNFESEAPMDLFRMSAKGIPPSFYVYRFEDRANRVGEAELLESGAFETAETAYVSSAEIPQALKDAFVAIEDKRFYRHRGVDWYRTIAAGVTYALGFSDTFGGSTITQQTVKNVTGRNEVTPSRKLQEILYALDLERRDE